MHGKRWHRKGLILFQSLGNWWRSICGRPTPPCGWVASWTFVLRNAEPNMSADLLFRLESLRLALTLVADPIPAEQVTGSAPR